MQAISRDARFWDRIARKYAADPIKDMAGYKRTLEQTRTLLGRNDTVLELGCGTGSTALLLAPHVSRILAIDVSAEMIAIAGEKAAAERVGNVEFMVGDAVHPGLADGGFDAILAFNLLHLVADRQALLASVLRLLRPCGLFISKTPCLTEMNPLIRLAVPAMRAIGKAPHVAFFSGLDLAEEVAAAGFEITEQARHGSGPKDARLFLVARKPGARGNG